jgi:3-oxoacyl-[acyl-carrier-protein] synthase III
MPGWSHVAGLFSKGVSIMNKDGCVITGWGAAVPPTLVTNEDLESLLRTSDDWIVERSGIHSRYQATGPFVARPQPFEREHPGTTATLAIESGRRALDAAGMASQEVGALLLCTSTPDFAIPATAATVAGALGISGAAMDLNAACAGFTYGLVTAGALISIGAGPVLLIGAETMSRVINWGDRTNAFLFGDGAGAVVLDGVDGRGSLLGWNLGVEGSLVELLYAEQGSGIVMRGQEVFRRAVQFAVQSAHRALEHAEVELSEVSLFVPHQANRRIMNAMAERLGIAESQVVSVIERSGNTSAASIPLALIDAIKRGRVQRGKVVLFSGFGAGMTWASVVWRWGADDE